jgi:hypothetical protein
VGRRLEPWTRHAAGLLVLTLALAGSATAAAAAEKAAPAQQATTLLASASAAVAAKPLPAGTLAQAAPQSTATDTGSKSFFSTTAGRLALVAMAAGTGYMVYSAFKDNDPVKSVFR